MTNRRDKYRNENRSKYIDPFGTLSTQFVMGEDMLPVYEQPDSDLKGRKPAKTELCLRRRNCV
jgi:hypothetical protein